MESLIYNSNSEKLKNITTIILIGLFSLVLYRQGVDWTVIFVVFIILVIILLKFVNDSNSEKFKNIITILIIGWLSWAVGGQSDNGNGFIGFIVISAFFIFIMDKIYKEKEIKKANKLLRYVYDVKKYGKYLISNPLGIEEIRCSSELPFQKEDFIQDSILYIKEVEKTFQKTLLNSIPMLAYFRDDISKNYISNIGNFINNDKYMADTINKLKYEVSLNKSSSETIDDLAKKLNEDNCFPNDLYYKCNEESKKILSLLEKSIKS